MRNWFQRWLSLPWIGNYDLLLASSPQSVEFMRSISSSVKLRTACSVRCPMYPVNTFAAVDSDFAGAARIPMNGRPLISRRLDVPIELFPLATNYERFQEQENATNDGINFDSRFVGSTVHPVLAELRDAPIGLKLFDYVFSGSYFNKYRRIMAFDPGHPLLSRKNGRGVIFGSGWSKANVTDNWKRIAVGLVPYESLPKVIISYCHCQLDFKKFLCF